MEQKTIAEKAQSMRHWYNALASVQAFVRYSLGSSYNDLCTDEDWAAVYDLFIEDRDRRNNRTKQA